MQRQLVASVADRCREVGLLFVLEVLTYSLRSPKGSMESMRERPFLVIKATEDLSHFADVMKVQYPTHPDTAASREEQLALCQRLNEACNRPWALLSEGVEMDAFCQQLEIACRAGAAGFMAGRVLWREALAATDSKLRQQILATDGVARLARLSDIVRRFGQPWTRAGTWPMLEAR